MTRHRDPYRSLLRRRAAPMPYSRQCPGVSERTLWAAHGLDYDVAVPAPVDAEWQEWLSERRQALAVIQSELSAPERACSPTNTRREVPLSKALGGGFLLQEARR